MDEPETEQQDEKAKALELREQVAATETPLDQLRWSHRRFVIEYLHNGYNATQAAIKAGYSKRTARFEGCVLLKREDIKKAVEWGMEQEGIGPQHLKSLIADIICNSDIGNFIEPADNANGWKISVLDEEGNLKDGTHLIKHLSTGKNGTTTITVYSRLEALELAAKALGLYSTSNINQTFLNIESMQRAVSESLASPDRLISDSAT